MKRVAILMAALEGSAKVIEGWAEVSLARQAFRFLVGDPLCICGNRLQPLAAAASITRDTLYLPLQFLAEILPTQLGNRYRYDGRRARSSTPPRSCPTSRGKSCCPMDSGRGIA